jgi:hypothetical protein
MKPPDWEALNDLHFLLGPRISGLLNEALNAMILLDMPDTGVDPQVWRDRARAKLGNLLNLYEAWSALIQHKNGISLPHAKLRPFSLQNILDWLSVQLELMPPALAPSQMMLQGHQASLQEALLLLYSVGRTQGSNLHLSLAGHENGYWFKVCFLRPKPMLLTPSELLASFDTKKWISRDSAFELMLALDFLALNQSPFEMGWNDTTHIGEFRFFVRQSGAEIEALPGLAVSPDAEHAKFVANITRSMMPSVASTALATPAAASLEDPDPQATQPILIVDGPTEPIIVPDLGNEGMDENAAKAEAITTPGAEASESREALEALMVEGVKRGAQLLLELQGLDQLKAPDDSPSLPDIPTAIIPTKALLPLPDEAATERPTVAAEAHIITVVIPEPTLPEILKPRTEAQPQETSA